MTSLILGLLKNIKLSYVLYFIAFIAIGFVFFKYHTLPINHLKKEVQVCTSKVSEKDLKINNLQEELKQCQHNYQIELLNLEICNAQAGVYNDDNTTIKDTSDEGYLIF